MKERDISGHSDRVADRSLFLQYFLFQGILVYCITHISHNDLPEFLSAALSSIDDATASPHSSALQAEHSFCAIMRKVNETVH